MNEVYSTCGNDGCQRSCNRLNIANCNPSCTNPGCVCASGYVKNDLNQCILPSMCRKYHINNRKRKRIIENNKFKFSAVNTCNRVNEVYSACGDDGCQLTCNRLNVSSCTRYCSSPGCICAVGYVRNSISQCVPPSECSK